VQDVPLGYKQNQRHPNEDDRKTSPHSAPAFATGPLAPGGKKNFRLAFDNIPESWNQALPQLVIAQTVFG
jgi:hypothetical protein